MRPGLRRWTAEEDEVLLLTVVRRNARLTNAELQRLSRELDRSETGVASRVSVLRERYGVPRQHAQGELIGRACLSCGTRFQAQARFIRVCHGCKAQDAWRAGA
jgi:hypothetical protein